MFYMSITRSRRGHDRIVSPNAVPDLGEKFKNTKIKIRAPNTQ